MIDFLLYALAVLVVCAIHVAFLVDALRDTRRARRGFEVRRGEDDPG